MRANSCLKSFASLGLALLTPAFKTTAQVLPPPPVEKTPQLFVNEFQFEGASAFTQSELSAVTAPFTGRNLNSDELEEARRAVTLHYINNGYVNSGAILPDQDPSNGIVKIQIVEGTLTKVDVRDNKWLRDGYLRSRLRRWSEPPLNLNELKEGLQLLRQNPNIKQVNAELQPGAAPGESILDLRVEDQHPFRVALQIDNQRPPSVGGEQIVLNAADVNLTGNSDVLELNYGIANSGASDNDWGFSGLDDVGGRYTLPFTPYDTTIGLHGSRVSTSIVEEPFTLLDIDSETSSYGVVFRQPFFQTANREFALSLGFDRRRNDTSLLGEPFDFQSSGSVDGRTEVSVLRFSQEWIDRGQNHVLALRSTFNFGIDAFSTTDNDILGDPNATFFSWVGQGQYIQRLFNTPNRAIFRVTGQWTGERLLALEQMSVGGINTVRGYRENQLVRDNGVVASFELRFPVWFNKAGASMVELAPFVDVGGAWNIHEDRTPETLASAGLGLVLNPCKNFDAQLFWGYRLRDIDLPDNNPQDLGLHFRIRFSAF